MAAEGNQYYICVWNQSSVLPDIIRGGVLTVVVGLVAQGRHPPDVHQDRHQTGLEENL